MSYHDTAGFYFCRTEEDIGIENKMATAKDKAKEEKILQLRKAGAEALVRTESERLGIGIEPDFGEEKIQINCKMRDSSVMRLRADYRNFTDGASNIFRFIELMAGPRENGEGNGNG